MKQSKQLRLVILLAIVVMAAIGLLGVLLQRLNYRRTFGFTITSPYWVHPDEILRAAGYDPTKAKRFKPEWDTDIEDREVWKLQYDFEGRTVTLSIDSKTSQLVDISSYPFEGNTTTGTVANLTAGWARQKLLDMNVWQVRKKTFHMAEPIIRFDPHFLYYRISFPRTDAHGHWFQMNAASFSFDIPTSRVLGVGVGWDLPEPEMTTGTMISQEQATRIALQWHLDARSKFFEHVPEKMTFDYVPESTVVRVVESELTTGTVVAYVIRHFKSRLTDPSYTGRYAEITTEVYVDVFTGEVVGGHSSKMYVGGH